LKVESNMYDFSEHKLHKSNINIVYYNFLLKYSVFLKKNVYIAHITVSDQLSLSNLFQIFRANKKAIEVLKESDLLITKSNSIVFSIYELKEGFKFIFDRRIFEKIIKNKEEVENAFNIKLGGMIFVIDKEHSSKHVKDITKLCKFFKVDYLIFTTNSLEQALIKIKKISKI